MSVIDSFVAFANEVFRPLLLVASSAFAVYFAGKKIGHKVLAQYSVGGDIFTPFQIREVVFSNKKDKPVSIYSIYAVFEKDLWIELEKFSPPATIKPFESASFKIEPYVIPDSHPEFSEDIVQLELAEFSFANGKVQFGSFDRSESFVLFADGVRYYFWHGIRQPDQSELDEFSRFLTANELQLPVVAQAKWSETERTFHGFQFIDSLGERREIAI